MKGIILILALAVLIAAVPALGAPAARAFTQGFGMDKSDLSSTGRNPYVILEPGYQLFYKSGSGDLTITVLDETKLVDGVETRIVEERENENGKLIEVSRNYFAISKSNASVFYFGEDVDMYGKDGKITHGGTWHAGVNGARAGLAMPAVALLGARFHQEVAPKEAMDRSEIVSVTETLKTPAGKFTKVVKTEETTPLEPGAKEYKWYAPGVGLVKDSELVLVKYGSAK